jgi:NADH-quinone oxidoreductase subunit N
MSETFIFEVQHILPDLVLSVIGILILIADPFVSRPNKSALGLLALAGVLTASVCTVNLIGDNGTYFSGMVIVDNFGTFFRFIFLLISGLTILASLQYLQQQKLYMGEYHSLILFATVGMDFMAVSNDLIMTFLGLEVLSVSCYVLLGARRVDPKSNESALKYFLLGSFSSAFLLYGIALAYGSTKSTNLEVIAQRILAGSVDMRLISVAMGLMFVGFGFKVATAPFHVWTPDVYEGAPIPITAFMSAGPKAAGFAIFIRVFLTALPVVHGKWSALLWASAVLTMTLGNVIAMVQSNIKRMLAYSSIAHAGYILVAFTAGNENGIAAVLFYMLAYAVMNIGAFTIVALMARSGEQQVSIDDYSGMGFKQPMLSASLSIFLLSLAGIPLTAGFAGKFFIFRAAIESHLVWLAIFGVLNSAISVYYYLRVIVTMYMKEPTEELVRVSVPLSTAVVLSLTLFGIFQLGIYPDFLLNLARRSVLNFP